MTASTTMKGASFMRQLALDVNDGELHDLFRKYGNIQRVKVMPARRNADSKFAFVEFGSANDAQDAARGRDGIKFADNNIRVEISRPGRRAETGMIVVATAGTASTVGVQRPSPWRGPLRPRWVQRPSPK